MKDQRKGQRKREKCAEVCSRTINFLNDNAAVLLQSKCVLRRISTVKFAGYKYCTTTTFCWCIFFSKKRSLEVLSQSFEAKENLRCTYSNINSNLEIRQCVVLSFSSKAFRHYFCSGRALLFLLWSKKRKKNNVQSKVVIEIETTSTTFKLNRQMKLQSSGKS